METLNDPEDTSVKPFAWLPNMANCGKYWRIYSQNAEEWSIEDTSKDPYLLYIEDPSLPFGLCGTANFAVMDYSAEKRMSLLAGTYAVIMVRNSIERDHKVQAIAQLVAISLTTSQDVTPFVVLTDLNYSWFFLWLSDSNDSEKVQDEDNEDPNDRLVMQVHVTYPKNAMNLYEAVGYAGSFVDVSFDDSCFGFVGLDSLVPRIVPTHAHKELA